MIGFNKYIEKKFPNELKLLIFLSQDELKQASFAGELNQIDWDEFITLAIKHRLTSHLLKHSKYLADHLPIPVYEKLIEIRLDHSKRSLNYAVHAIRIHQKFKENNISHCFFKGPLLSLELYKDIGYRNFGDIDILVDKKDVEEAKNIIEELDFKCIYPKTELTEKQKRINYSISHHYHFVHPIQSIDIELHWSITNPESFFATDSHEIISNSRNLKVSNYELPYISEVNNLVYQAAHGSIHQFYRLFWLKDFSVLLSKTNPEELKQAWELSLELKLENCFWQACQLAHIMYNCELPNYISQFKKKSTTLRTALQSIHRGELKQQGIKGKFRYVFYRLGLKPSRKYYFDLIYRLRTHLSDWERIQLPDKLFFMYYVLRPFLLIFKSISKKQ